MIYWKNLFFSKFDGFKSKFVFNKKCFNYTYQSRNCSPTQVCKTKYRNIHFEEMIYAGGITTYKHRNSWKFNWLKISIINRCLHTMTTRTIWSFHQFPFRLLGVKNFCLCHELFGKATDRNQAIFQFAVFGEISNNLIDILQAMCIIERLNSRNDEETTDVNIIRWHTHRNR